MTEKMIENRVKKLQAIEAQQKELEVQADAIRAELKADLEEKGVDELKTKNFILRWKEIISSRLDSKALKAASRMSTASSAAPALPGASPSHEKGPLHHPPRRLQRPTPNPRGLVQPLYRPSWQKSRGGFAQMEL